MKTNLKEKYSDFNPEGPETGYKGIFGLPFSEKEAQIILLGVPWGPTVSYGGGAHLGPELVYDASDQLDLFDDEIGEVWKMGIYFKNLPLQEKDEETRKLVAQYRKNGYRGSEKINAACNGMIKLVQEEFGPHLQLDKIPGIIGGEHSVSLGLINSLSTLHNSIGILQIDAHADLRKSYEGLEHSHASIMYNVLKNPSISKLVQVGVRDFSPFENEIHKKNTKKISLFSSRSISKSKFKGSNWDQICNKIVETLPQMVYISLDIDGLSPEFCPGTGTPVPGGLSFMEVRHLISKVVETGKTIIGFDLVEVAGKENELNGNIGARLVYLLCGYAAQSRKLTTII